MSRRKRVYPTTLTGQSSPAASHSMSSNTNTKSGPSPSPSPSPSLSLSPSPRCEGYFTQQKTVSTYDAMQIVSEHQAVIKNIATVSPNKECEWTNPKHSFGFIVRQLSREDGFRPERRIPDAADRTHQYDPYTGYWYFTKDQGGAVDPRFTDMTSVSLMPPSGQMKLYGVTHGIALLFDMNKCKLDRRFIFSSNKSTNDHWWYDGSHTKSNRTGLSREKRYRAVDLKDLRQEQIDTAIKNGSVKWNELLAGLTADAVIGVVVPSNTLQCRLNAQYRQLILLRKLNLAVPIFIQSTPEGIREYTVAEQEKDLREAAGSKGAVTLSFYSAIDSATASEKLALSQYKIFDYIRAENSNKMIALLQQSPAAMTLKNSEGISAFALAIKLRKNDIVSLMRLFLSDKHQFNLGDAVAYAILQEQYDLAQELLKNTPNAACFMLKNTDRKVKVSESALHLLIEKGEGGLSLLLSLLEKDHSETYINLKATFDFNTDLTPLEMAARYQNDEAFSLLISYGAKITESIIPYLFDFILRNAKTKEAFDLLFSKYNSQDKHRVFKELGLVSSQGEKSNWHSFYDVLVKSYEVVIAQEQARAELMQENLETHQQAQITQFNAMADVTLSKIHSIINVVEKFERRNIEDIFDREKRVAFKALSERLSNERKQLEGKIIQAILDNGAKLASFVKIKFESPRLSVFQGIFTSKRSCDEEILIAKAKTNVLQAALLVVRSQSKLKDSYRLDDNLVSRFNYAIKQNPNYRKPFGSNEVALVDRVRIYVKECKRYVKQQPVDVDDSSNRASANISENRRDFFPLNKGLHKSSCELKSSDKILDRPGIFSTLGLVDFIFLPIALPLQILRYMARDFKTYQEIAESPIFTIKNIDMQKKIINKICKHSGLSDEVQDVHRSPKSLDLLLQLRNSKNSHEVKWKALLGYMGATTEAGAFVNNGKRTFNFILKAAKSEVQKNARHATRKVMKKIANEAAQKARERVEVVSSPATVSIASPRP